MPSPTTPTGPPTPGGTSLPPLDRTGAARVDGVPSHRRAGATASRPLPPGARNRRRTRGRWARAGGIRSAGIRLRGGRSFLLLPGVVLAVVIALLGAGPATAGGWALSDGFDNAAPWQFAASGGQTTGRILGTGSPSSPGPSAALTTTGPNWSSVGRAVRLTPAQYHQTQCTAQVELRASSTGSTSVVNIEVIDPTTWTYVALNQVHVTGSNWQSFTVGPWRPGPVNVFFRVSLLGANAYRYAGVDHLVIYCTY